MLLEVMLCKLPKFIEAGGWMTWIKLFGCTNLMFKAFILFTEV